MAFYMTGTTTCRTRVNAEMNVAHYGKPAVIRFDGAFYIVTRLAEKPVQPGQFEFKLEVGETVHNWGPPDA